MRNNGVMKYYDKIFFLVALVVIGASCAFYFVKKPNIAQEEERVQKLLSEKPKGVVWKEIAVPEMKITMIEWPEVRPQDEEGKWFFQVFTPPQIWVDKDGNFMTESPYMKEKARQSFEFKYTGVSNEPYPIHYKGYIGDIKNPIIQLENVNTKEMFNGKLNQEIVLPKTSVSAERNLGLTVKSFDMKRIKMPDNTITSVSTLVIFDRKLGKDITIVSNKETVLLDQRRITLTANDGTPWHIKAVGETTNTKGAKYVVKGLDFDAGKVTVEMIPNDKSIEPQVMELSESGIEPLGKQKK